MNKRIALGVGCIVLGLIAYFAIKFIFFGSFVIGYGIGMILSEVR